MKKIFIILIALLIIPLASCTDITYSYSGDYPDLYSVVLYSIPDTIGYFSSEIMENPRIELLETDDFGRKLFMYYEGNSVSTYSLVIQQYSLENEVCFYSDYDFISSPSEQFSEEAISLLKTNNDWNNELQESNCECKQQITKKGQVPLSFDQIQPFYEIVFPGDEHFSDDRWIRYFLTDDYGRILVTVEARNKDEWAVMAFNPDATYDAENGYLVLTDFFTYQSLLKDYKETIGWNEPFM